MNILILGGTGLISTAITRELVARGDRVTLYNRGQREPVTAGTAAGIPAGLPALHGDRKDYPAFERQMAGAGMWDCVIDMIAFLPDDVQSAIRAFRGRTGQYIFCSTVDVYTKPAKSYPIREDAEKQPATTFPYAWNKARCEEILFAAHERGDLNVTAIRPAHTYGEGGRLVHTLGFDSYLIDRIRKGLPIIVHGDGRSLWGSCHRDDVGHAFVSAVCNPKTSGRAYHVTGEEWNTWDRYYQGIAEAMGWPAPRLVHIPSELLGRALPKMAMWAVENFSYNNIFDNAAAHADLDFRYTIRWVEGARRLVTFMQQQGQVQDASACPVYDRILDAWAKAGAGMVAELAGLDQ